MGILSGRAHRAFNAHCHDPNDWRTSLAAAELRLFLIRDGPLFYPPDSATRICRRSWLRHGYRPTLEERPREGLDKLIS